MGHGHCVANLIKSEVSQILRGWPRNKKVLIPCDGAIPLRWEICWNYITHRRKPKTLMHQYNSTMGVCMSHFWQEQEPWLPTNKHQTRTNKVPWFVHVVYAPAKDGDLAGGTEFECTKHQQHSFCDFLPNEVAFHSLFSWYMINTCCPAPNWWANWCDLYVFVVCSFCSFVQFVKAENTLYLPRAQFLPLNTASALP